MSSGALFHPNLSTHWSAEKRPLSYSVGPSLIALDRLYQNIINVQTLNPVIPLLEIDVKETIKYICYEQVSLICYL